jgi:hypothetical protein
MEQPAEGGDGAVAVWRQGVGPGQGLVNRAVGLGYVTVETRIEDAGAPLEPGAKRGGLLDVHRVVPEVGHGTPLLAMIVRPLGAPQASVTGTIET